jgi:hypothetical protein
MATIVMSAEKVIEAATKVIAEIEARRNVENEGMISEKMKDKRFILFGRTLTRDEAIKELKDARWSFYPCMYYWSDLNHVRKLLKLAQHGDPVTLNEEDTSVLF